MSLLGLRGDAQADERLERRATRLLTALLTGSASALAGQVHPSFVWFTQPIAPAELTPARLAGLLAAAGRRVAQRPRVVPEALVRAWATSEPPIVPPAAGALVLVDVAPERGLGDVVTVAVALTGAEADASLVAVLDAALLVPHLRAVGDLGPA